MFLPALQGFGIPATTRPLPRRSFPAPARAAHAGAAATELITKADIAASGAPHEASADERL
jgi:hypothetical protein